MQNNDYAEIFCQAVDTILQKALKDLSFNTTIKCIITSVNPETKEYEVDYNGCKYKAKSIISEDLKEKDNVYALVINNDFSYDKIIIGKEDNITV